MKNKPKNPNITDPAVILEIKLQMKSMKPTELMQDVLNDSEFKEFKKRCNEKGYE